MTTTERPERFGPPVSPESAPYWQACNENRLVVEHCARCDAWQFFPRGHCTACGGDVRFETASGRATVRTHTIVRLPVAEAYASEVPFVAALVELEEGPTMMTRIETDAPESVAIGDAVRVDFVQWTDAQRVPIFRPV